MNRFSNFEETNAFVQSLLAPDKTTNVETTGNGEETLEYDMHEDTLNIDTQAKTEKSITSEITFDTIFAKQIFINAKTIQTPATKPRPTTQHVFLPGRMFYTWDLHMEAEDAPNVLVQSQSIGYVVSFLLLPGRNLFYCTETWNISFWSGRFEKGEHDFRKTKNSPCCSFGKYAWTSRTSTQKTSDWRNWQRRRVEFFMYWLD